MFARQGSSVARPEPAESALSTQLAGTMIDADIHGRGSEADAIALGLLAGWKVGGTIRGGNLFVGLAAPTRDVNTWLEVALARPVGRVALLDPDARHVAIGPALPGNGSKAIGAVVTTYSLFESSNHNADVSRIVARVASARAARGVTPWLLWTEGVSSLRERKRFWRERASPWRCFGLRSKALPNGPAGPYPATLSKETTSTRYPSRTRCFTYPRAVWSCR